MVRIFIAIDLPPAVRERIRECQKAFSETEAKLTLVRADSAHITLKFIGEVDPDRLEPIIAALCTIRFEPFAYEVCGIGANNLRSPRVIWCNVKDGGGCGDLHHRIEEVLTPFGIPKESRSYTPHVTLARVKRPHPSLLPVLKQRAGEYLGNGEAQSIRLKKSTLLPEGPRYEDLAEVKGI